MLAQHEYTLEPGADATLRRILGGLRAGEDSGNARFARTLFEQALNRQALRLTLDKDNVLMRSTVPTSRRSPRTTSPRRPSAGRGAGA